MFYISRMDGVLDAWDLLQQQNEPVLSMKVCDEPIRCIRSHECGNLVSVGSEKGAMYLLEVSDNMTFSSKNDKPLFTAMLERESKREKILEAKLRELKLKNKTAQRVDEDTEEQRQSRVSGLERACNQARTDYFKVVERIRASRSPDKFKGNRKMGGRGPWLTKCDSCVPVNYSDYDVDEVALANAPDEDDLEGEEGEEVGDNNEEELNGAADEEDEDADDYEVGQSAAGAVASGNDEEVHSPADGATNSGK